MNWSKFELKTIYSIFQVTNSYFFNDKHNAGTYLNVIEQILKDYDLLEGRKCSGWEMTSDFFKTVVYRRNNLDFQIDCEIDFETTTLTITAKV